MNINSLATIEIIYERNNLIISFVKKTFVCNYMIRVLK